ncbi:MAG: UDP-N-acetylmuramoyl-L-alanyl-D-glutamate--2,6-diaminopimelate ligase [Acidimicrobiales bacterium]
MQLGDVLDLLDLDVKTASIEITRVEIDSRRCEPGTLFFALAGESSHGAHFIDDAVRRGAVAVVTGAKVRTDAALIVVPEHELRAVLAHASSAIVGRPDEHLELVGVTGTNGKTSITTLVAALTRSLGWNGANVGTLTNERTTPAPPELFRTLAALVKEFDATRGRSIVALEVSSHALSQHRVEGLRFEVVAFTNLSHDHLDYHGTMEDYFAVKASLFSLDHAQRAVIWSDDPYGERLAEMTSLPLTRVRRTDAKDVVSTLRGTMFFWRSHLVNTSLVGDYNVDNALMAMEIARALGADEGAIASAMAGVSAVPGRFEVVSEGDVVVIVDYAHTPQGLRRLLEGVRSLLSGGRVITVFGCGGDRDRAKRPEMGEVASANSEITIVTSDNPRSEMPDAIIDAIVSGTVPGATVYRQVDRRLAIAQALELAGPGDAVVIAGKGHETTQVIGDLVVPFDDRAVVRELLK